MYVFIIANYIVDGIYDVPYILILVCFMIILTKDIYDINNTHGLFKYNVIMYWERFFNTNMLVLLSNCQMYLNMIFRMVYFNLFLWVKHILGIYLCKVTGYIISHDHEMSLHDRMILDIDMSIMLAIGYAIVEWDHDDLIMFCVLNLLIIKIYHHISMHEFHKCDMLIFWSQYLDIDMFILHVFVKVFWGKFLHNTIMLCWSHNCPIPIKSIHIWVYFNLSWGFQIILTIDVCKVIVYYICHDNEIIFCGRMFLDINMSHLLNIKMSENVIVKLDYVDLILFCKLNLLIIGISNYINIHQFQKCDMTFSFAQYLIIDSVFLYGIFLCQIKLCIF